MDPAPQVYAAQLTRRGYGHALWVPEPYDSAEVQIGDVGFVTHEGSFFRLFNAMYPASHPINGNEVPADFEPLTLPDRLVRTIHNWLEPGALCSHSIRKVDVSASGSAAAGTGNIGASYRFTCNENQGALLILKDHADRRRIIDNLIIPKYMNKHRQSWYTFATEVIRVDVKLDDIVTVRGWVKTTEWAVAAFLDKGTAHEVAMELGHGPYADLTVSVSVANNVSMSVEHRSGPIRSSASNHTCAAAKDQCVFLETYKAKKRSFLAITFKLKANAEPTDDHRPSTPDYDVVASPHSSESEGSMVCADPAIITVCDPLDDILDYILEYSDAEIAVASQSCFESLHLLAGHETHTHDIESLRQCHPEINVDEGKVGTLRVTDPILIHREAHHIRVPDEAKLPVPHHVPSASNREQPPCVSTLPPTNVPASSSAAQATFEHQPLTRHTMAFEADVPFHASTIIQQRRTKSPLSSDTPSSSGAGQEGSTNEEYHGSSATAKENSDFLDVDASDTEYSINDSGRASAVDSVDQDSESMQSRAEDGPGGRPKRAAVEEFPLPPTTPPAVESFAQAQLQRQQSLRSISISTSETLVASDTASQSTHANGSADARGASPQYAPPSSASQNCPPPVIPLMAFRALPLLASDLPQTTIQVSQSSIRPNERGKDMLSFVIVVNPGNEKPSWKIEKLYSDVLTLDARVRATLGKTLSKKLVALPEGRLWRDHAPAKVDQRKAALEQYLRSLIAFPTKNKDEIVAFFTSGIANEAQKPVTRAGYKEGYLTKRGKNFGGLKTRYFMLQGPTLEYYESRGGAHLGSILITGAQIGRQQQMPGREGAGEENEYRHAFSIIEAKKGPSGSNPRHVLCAESDMERDSWVEVLVRYVSGRYSEEDVAGSIDSGSRTSISSTAETAVTPTRRPRKEEIAKGPAVPIAQLPPDAANAKLFQAAPSPEEALQSPVKSANPLNQVVQSAKGGTPLSSSPHVSSPLAADDTDPFANVGQRANSEMGHYSDLVDQRAVMKNRPTTASPEQRRMNKRRSINPLKTSPIPERPPSPEKDAAPNTPRVDVNAKVKTSSPMNGIPIPTGYRFGGKDAPPEQSSQSDRREKAKSRSFWGFGRQIHDKPNVPVHVPRAVFGVALEESLNVAEIASLPAIVFRCIQYLEAKKAEQEEGIYRLSGSSAVIMALKDRFNNEGDVDLLASDEYWGPHAIAGLLKTFLRELPASILTRDLHLRFLSVIDFVDPQERISELSQLIASLPIANYILLRALIAHLILIVQNANVNKMTMRNVGIVFSPTLGIPAGVFSLMLGEFKRVFDVDGTLDEEDPPAPEGQPAEASDFSRRNSKRYSDAAADQLLGLSGRTLSKEEAQSDEGGEYSMHDESGTEETGEVDSHTSRSQLSSLEHVSMSSLQAHPRLLTNP